MLMLKLVPAFFLFLFLQLSVQVQLPPGQAYAACICCAGCGAKICGMCCCRGALGCPFCRSGDTDIVQSGLLIDKASADIRAMRDLDATDRFLHLATVGDCARRSFALRALGNTGESLKIESFRFGEENIRDRTVMLKFAANGE
jgi:hypothetical protein